MNEEHSAESSLRSLLIALGQLTFETATHLEELSGHISHDMLHPGKKGRNLVVRLQGFDRMRQELCTIGESVESCAALISTSAPSQHVRNIIEAIPLAQMKKKLLRKVAFDEPAPAAPEIVPEASELDSDHIF
jgi:hypothetical protein